MDEITAKISELKLAHPAGFVKTPDNLSKFPNLSASSKKAILPRQIDERHRLTKGKNQYDKPECAGFATAAYGEYVLWRKNDYPVTIDPHKIYAHAKKIDGMGGGEGTSLTAAMQSLLDLGYFNPKVCYVGVIQNLQEVKYACNKWGCCTVGLNICEELYYCTPKRPYIDGKTGYTKKCGGHALLCVGYIENNDGTTDYLISNSWGCSEDTGGEWGMHGTALITENMFKDEFMYGAVMCNCFNDFAMGIRV